jgi:hypothetical protein
MGYIMEGGIGNAELGKREKAESSKLKVGDRG